MVDLTRLKVQGFAGLKGHMVSRVPKSEGLRVSRDRGSPQVNRGSLRSGVSKIQRFQGPRDEELFLGLQGPGIKGDKGLLGPCRSKGLKVPRA